MGVALGGASFYSERSPSAARAEERGDKKPRGRGHGQRNIDLWRVLLATFFKPAFFFFGFLLQVSFKTRVALPEATPSPFGTATLRLAPSALAALGLRSAAKCAPLRATNLFNLKVK